MTDKELELLKASIYFAKDVLVPIGIEIYRLSKTDKVTEEMVLAQYQKAPEEYTSAYTEDNG